MKDQYKAEIIQKEMDKIKDNQYYMVQLKGDTGKAINLDLEALRILRFYYEGRM